MLPPVLLLLQAPEPGLINNMANVCSEASALRSSCHMDEDLAAAENGDCRSDTPHHQLQLRVNVVLSDSRLMGPCVFQDSLTLWRHVSVLSAPQRHVQRSWGDGQVNCCTDGAVRRF